MKFKIIIGAILLAAASCETKKDHSHLEGAELYKTVEQYVSFGDHRTATTGDYATSAWLEKELIGNKYSVKFTEFPLKQFFLDSATVTDVGNESRYEAFPLWYVNDSIPRIVEGSLVTDTRRLAVVRDKIVLLNFDFGAQGQSAKSLRKKLADLSQAGARGIIGFNENKSGEIAAFNAERDGKPWQLPIVIVTQDDAKILSARGGQTIRISIAGKFEEVLARNVYGTLGTGEEYIVISTPISGWFTCGGERGPGVALWLGLAKWVSTQDFPYTFVFTGNSGHELGFWGADEFLEHDAPPVDKTKLWIHFGAGAATLKFNSTPSGLVRVDSVDDKRNFFYTTSVKSEFNKAFQHIGGNKWDTNEKNGGELINVVNKGYKQALGVSYAHPYFHTKGDDASKTSPAVLEEAALAFKTFIEEVTHQQLNK